MTAARLAGPSLQGNLQVRPSPATRWAEAVEGRGKRAQDRAGKEYET